jgi:hypothetical protein
VHTSLNWLLWKDLEKIADEKPREYCHPDCCYEVVYKFSVWGLGSLVSFVRYLGVRMLLLKLCDVNRGRKRGCCGRALEARESLESIIIVGQRGSHGVSKGLSCRVRRKVGRSA